MHKLEVEDLQDELLQIKKINLEIRRENQFLKVKLMKLTDEISKKNRQLDTLLDPKKSICVSKALSSNGPALIMNLKQENTTLCKRLADKDLQLKKLQSELETTRLYINDKTKLKSSRINENIYIANEDYICNSYADFLQPPVKHRSRSVTTDKRISFTSPPPGTPEEDDRVEKDYMTLINNNLQKIKQCGQILQNEKTSPPTIPNKTDAPHEEIQQLHTYLLNVLTEVDCLKNTICELQKQQTETSLVLYDKSSDINKLVTEITTLNHQVITCTTGVNTQKRPGSSPDSLTTEPMSTDMPTTEYDSEHSEYTEYSVELSVPSTKRSSRKKKVPTQSISIQTTRTFCSEAFSTVESQTTTRTDQTNDECDIEVEYIA